MRITEFVYNLIDRFSPMQELDRTELRRDAQKDYLAIKETIMDSERKLKEGVTVKTMTLKQKLIYYSEHWIPRTVLALLFIGCLRWVQDFVNPSEEEDDDEFEEVE